MRTNGRSRAGLQTDVNYSLIGNSVGLGLMFKVNEKVDLDLEMIYTVYDSDYKEGTYHSIVYKELYDKTNLGFAIGVTYHLFN